MYSDSEKSPKSKGVKDIENRISIIEEYITHYEYKAIPVFERLSPELASEYQETLDEIQELKGRLHTFKQKVKI